MNDHLLRCSCCCFSLVLTLAWISDFKDVAGTSALTAPDFLSWPTGFAVRMADFCLVSSWLLLFIHNSVSSPKTNPKANLALVHVMTIAPEKGRERWQQGRIEQTQLWPGNTTLTDWKSVKSRELTGRSMLWDSSKSVLWNFITFSLTPLPDLGSILLMLCLLLTGDFSPSVLKMHWGELCWWSVFHFNYPSNVMLWLNFNMLRSVFYFKLVFFLSQKQYNYMV